MDGLIRKLRGAFGTAVTWAAAWVVLTFPLSSIQWLLDDSFLRFSYWSSVGLGAAVAAASGFLAGGVFSIAVAGFGRHRRLEDLSTARMALLGAAAAAVVPVVLVALDQTGTLGLFLPEGWDLVLDWGGAALMGGVLAALGGATAGGLIRIAKSADREPLPPGE